MYTEKFIIIWRVSTTEIDLSRFFFESGNKLSSNFGTEFFTLFLAVFRSHLCVRRLALVSNNCRDTERRLRVIHRVLHSAVDRPDSGERLEVFGVAVRRGSRVRVDLRTVAQVLRLRRR